MRERADTEERHAAWRAAAGLALLAILTAPISVVADDSTAPPKRLRVIVHEDPPFVMRQGTRWAGWAIDLWDQVAHQSDFDWEVVGEAPANTVVDTLVAGGADVGVGDISVTKARDEVIDFTHPFYRSGLKILARTQGTSIRDALYSLATSAHLRLALGVLGLMIGMSVLIYVLARRHDPGNFPASRAEGMVEAVYIAAQALLKGQLDRKLLPGVFARVLTIAWMFFGAAVVAYLTAAVAAALTVQQINNSIQGIGDLAGRPVAAVSGSFVTGWLAERKIDVVEAPNLDTAIEALLSHRVDAVVHDAPVLTWWTLQHPGAPVDLVGHVFDRNDYAFAVPELSPLRVAINRALLELEEGGFFAELDRRWLEGPR
jgi:ABC-type amino acid transport substrate-binding protein